MLTRRSFGQLAATGSVLLSQSQAASTLLADEVEPKSSYRVGAAEVVVTPEVGTFLIGPMQESTGVHADLYARALAIESGDERCLIVTLDYLGFDFEFTARLVHAIAERTSLRAERVMINCSHTHNAPLTAPWGPWEKEKDKPFHRFLPERLAEVAAQAIARLAPADLHVVGAPVQVGFNRRISDRDRITMGVNPTGAVHQSVDVLMAVGKDKNLLAALFTHAAHPVVVHAGSTLISPDFPGFAVRAVREKHPGAIVMYAQGCCGNINAFPLQGGTQAAEKVGQELGAAVLRAMNGDRLLVSGPLSVLSEEVELPLQKPAPVETLREQIAAEKDIERRAKLEALLAIALDEKRPTMRYPLTAFCFGGELCLLGLPHDTFFEYQQHAVRVSRFESTFVFGYTGGLECYVGTARDYELGERGGYETSPQGAARMFESGTPLEPKSEKLVCDAITRLIDKRV